MRPDRDPTTAAPTLSADATAGDPRAAAWRDCWYPVAFSVDLPAGRLRRFSIHDEAYALFRDASGAARAVADRCPHRSARLSDGRLCDGRVECLYHGWQFDGDGQCQSIPQLGAGQPIPRRAHLRSLAVVEREGVVWAWAGDPDEADDGRIPLTTLLRDTGCATIDFAIDLPYDQGALVENVIDVAHIHIAHDGIRGGGRRELAAPLEFEVSELEPHGFSATYRTQARDGAAGDARLRGAEVEFVAPHIVHYRSLFADPDVHAGLLLYSLPLGRRRCRLLYRAYANRRSWRARLRPRWLEHWTQCRILEQDMRVVLGQHEEMRAADVPLRRLWLPLKSSDTLVLQYRRWLDRFAGSWPEYFGFATRRAERDAVDPAPQVDRHTLHTQHCAACTAALRWTRRVKAGALPVAFTALLVATVATPLGTVAAALAGLTYLGASLAERQFVATYNPPD